MSRIIARHIRCSLGGGAELLQQVGRNLQQLPSALAVEHIAGEDTAHDQRTCEFRQRAKDYVGDPPIL